MNNTDIKKMITDDEITHVFKNTNFGSVLPRDLIKDSLFKSVCGFHSGHTIECIIRELKLVTLKGSLTKKGKAYLFWSHYSN